MGINATVVVKKGDRDTLYLTELHIAGHDTTKSETRLLCAAVGMLSRTLIHTLAARKACAIYVDAPRTGNLSLIVKEIPTRLNEWFAGVSSVALQGLRDLAFEFDKQFVLKINDSDGNVIDARKL